MGDKGSPGKKPLEYAVKFIFRAYFNLLHGVTITGLENIPRDAERLVIVANHGSLLDGPLLWAFLPIGFTTVISREIAGKPVLRSFLGGERVIKVETLNSFSLKHVIRLVMSGRPLLIFPEGRRSVTGGFMKIYEGAGFVAYRSGATLLPVYIKNNYLIAASLKPGRKNYFARLTIHIGKPAPPFALEHLPVRKRRKEAASRIYGLMSQARFEATTSEATLGREFIRLCRENGGRPALKDVSRKEISYRKALIGAFLLGTYFSRFKDATVGLLLPNVSATVLLFMGLQLYRKLPAFLNYASGIASLRHMMDLADLRLIVTSREFLERIGMKKEVFEGRELVFLEDVKARITRRNKLAAF
ncbi:MAG: 1-acyl-sn-glycerol-3-phosphate acyltransferase, partial [Endomicrobiales bacterium]